MSSVNLLMRWLLGGLVLLGSEVVGEAGCGGGHLLLEEGDGTGPGNPAGDSILKNPTHSNLTTRGGHKLRDLCLIVFYISIL